MSDYTLQKEEYDELAREFFQERGYTTHIVGKKGRYPDLIIVNNTSGNLGVGVVEVKSPSETSACLTQAYRRRDYNLRGISRREVLEGLKSVVEPSELSIAHLLGVTISNQLYCYCWDVLERSSLYVKVVPKGWMNRMPRSIDDLEAYLVTPVAWRPIVEKVLAYFKAENYIPDYSLDQSTQLCVARVVYPNAQPIDLAI